MKYIKVVLIVLLCGCGYARAELSIKALSEAALLTNDYLIQEYLGDVYYFGEDKDLSKALSWYVRAAEQSAYAASKVSEIYRLGVEGKVDCQLAIEYAKKERAISRGESESLWLANMKAWVYATCSDKNFRNGALALETLGQYINKDNFVSVPAYILDTFAAAYAANNDFDNALKYQKLVLKRAQDLHANDLEYQLHLKFYEQEKVWIESEAILLEHKLIEPLSKTDKEILLLRKKRKVYENYYGQINSDIADIYVRLAKLYFDDKKYYLAMNYASRARASGVSRKVLEGVGIKLAE